jgi:predicted  nucleic acid-binding Zn-ribbon protein
LRAGVALPPLDHIPQATVQGFEERAAKLETDIADAQKRTKELETKVGATFEKEDRYQQLNRRQSEIEEQLDLTKNQAPSQVEADSVSETQQQTKEAQSPATETKPKKRIAVRV